MKLLSLWVVVLVIGLLNCAADGQEIADSASTSDVPAAAAEVQTGVAVTSIPDTAAAQATIIEVVDVGPDSGVGPGTPDLGPMAPVRLPGSAAVTPAAEDAATDSQPSTEPQVPIRRRHRRTGPDVAAASASTTPITSVVCKLDSLGNVADIVIYRQDGTVQMGCTAGKTALTGGRNVTLDFTDSLIVQVQQGKLTTAANGPVSWLMFRTDSGDARTCGLNVRPSSTQAVLANWQAVASTRTALSNLTITCASDVINATQTSQLNAISSATFSATLPALTAVATGVSTKCTRPFTQAAPYVTAAENDACKNWVVANLKLAKPPTNPTCPTTSPPNQWSYDITKQQLPTVRPPNWAYRALSTATTSTILTKRSSWLGGDPSYITAKVQHAKIPNVTSAMVSWWFNGNIDGDMVLNGIVYPRYLVWHPRDHVSQDTLIPGPTPGSVQGAWWSIIEFVKAPARYTTTSTSWANNYKAFVAISVYEMTSKSLELRVAVGTNTPFRLRHEWTDTTVGGSPALAMTSALYLGIQPPYDDLLNAPFMNPIAFQLYGGNCAVGAANAWMQHTVEEMGNFQFFLPQLYRART